MEQSNNEKRKAIIKASLSTPETALGRNFLSMADIVTDQFSADITGLTKAINDSARSNDQSSSRMFWLTLIIAFAAVGQIITPFITYYLSHGSK